MAGFLLRILINAIIICTIVVELPGIFVDTLGGTLLGAAIIGTANAAIRPFITLAAMPLNAVTVGACAFFTNLLAPLAVFKALPGFQVSSFLAPLAGIVLMTLCSYTVTRVIQDR
ncbi:phage holin family protein [Anaeroselena agilis]|uniref:Phage holin family protein n=1 Tax=Anaeroselena agilis TaxID=3063788 RepID=A0ABU3P4U4_9FIRM|nr:phage holin family protein [Selenomonadales bacterium 4137-cl]